jgi:hypothetical protein
MNMKAAALVLLLVPALAGGCGADRSYALVSLLSAGGQFNDVAGVTVQVRNDVFIDTLTYRPSTKQGLVRFDEAVPLTFSVGFRTSSHKGTLEVAVTPINTSGASLGYGVGTAQIAGDLTKVTVRVTRGALPPAGPDGGAGPGDGGAEVGPSGDAGVTCDPVSPTACNGGTCYLSCRKDLPPVGMCTMAGTKQPGELCMRNEECAAGSQCFDFSCGMGRPSVKACLRFCKDDSMCGAGQCATPIPCEGQPTTFKACSQACNPVGEAQQGCAAGLNCFVFQGEVPDCDCAGASHVKDVGVACTGSEECKPGLLCVSMAGNKTCRPVCRLDAPTCPSGQMCTKLVDPDYKTFGACL